MPQTESLIWIILACTGTICTVAMLGVFANVISYETRLHDLRNRVSELQYTYALRLARLHGHVPDEEEGSVDIIDEKTGKVIDPNNPVRPDSAEASPEADAEADKPAEQVPAAAA